MKMIKLGSVLWYSLAALFAGADAGGNIPKFGSPGGLEMRPGLARRLDEYPRQYVLWKPEEISAKLLEWKDKYPTMVRVTTGQDAYGLPRSGTANDCPHDQGGDGCLHYILTLQDFVAHPEDSDSSNRLPEVFLSGELHGNERVGPTAVMEAATLLLEAAQCEAKPNNDDVADGALEVAFETEIKTAKSCRQQLIEKGISDKHRQWLARLVTTRRVVIIPTANALGYFRNRREEDGIDPNRDFPFDVLDPKACMQTIAGRTINEVYREHMFQLSLTFHGGTEVIGYEWGAPTYLHRNSPDDRAQSEIAHAYSRYGGGWKTSHSYDVGDMNDKVYYVRGGMEDWAYAGSFDPKRVISCKPTTYDPYPEEKTIYNNSTLRVFNMLVETSHRKIPPTSDLGTSQDVLSRDTTRNGHVSRNIRLSLAAIDLVEPYVSIVGVNDLSLSDDIVPSRERKCETLTKTIMIPKNTPEITVEWSVGGVLDVDETTLWFAKNPEGESIDCQTQPERENVEKTFKEAIMLGATKGTGFFAPQGSSPHPSVSKTDVEPALGPLFIAKVDVSELQPNERLTVIASARVDSAWQEQPSNVGPDLPPQSHVVNARTNPSWHHESAGKVIQGRLDWFSVPIVIVVGEYEDSIGSQEGKELSTVEVSNRFGHTTGMFSGGISPSEPGDGSARKGSSSLLVGLALVAVSIVVFVGLGRYTRVLVGNLQDKRGFLPTGEKPYSDKVTKGDVEMEGFR